MSHVVEKIELDELLPTLNEKSAELVAREIDLIGHVSVELTAEIGNASISIEKLFALKQGDVVALAQEVSDPVLLRLNGKPVARGELVAVDDNLGVKITEIL
jgi:flagellar motor switch protein FliN/FliY